MEKIYPVMLGERIVGEVYVQKQGLYYIFYCKCHLSGEVMCRVSVVCGEKQENLGILVPDKDGFFTRTRIPVKKLGTGELKFCVTPKHIPVDNHFIPLRPEEPFAYIARLDRIYLQQRDQQYMAVIQDEGV